MEQLVVQGVRPAWGLVLVHGHGRIVGEVGIVQHLKHFVASDLWAKLVRTRQGCEGVCHIAREKWQILVLTLPPAFQGLLARSSFNTHSQEGSAHAADVFLLDTTIRGQDLALTSNLLGPLLLGELLTEAVPAKASAREGVNL